MKVYNHKDALAHLNYILEHRIEDAFIAVFDETAIHYGKDRMFNLPRALELNIPCYDVKREGGAFVASPGDIVYCFTTKQDESHFNMELRDFLAKKLTNKGITVQQTKNDLLVDGKKCFGFMHYKFNYRWFYGGHISIKCNLELIKEICMKEMVKVPCGLSDYNITTEEVIQWFHEFWFYFKK